jgi:hypothetical protein
VNDREKRFLAIQPERAEHSPRLYTAHLAQLIADKIFERFILLIHRAAPLRSKNLALLNLEL